MMAERSLFSGRMESLSSFPTIPDPPQLTEADRGWFGKLAVGALRRHFDLGEPGMTQPSPPHDGAVNFCPCGVFISLSSGGKLRGCLGSLGGSEPLSDSMPRLAVEAATRDLRFPPLGCKDLVALEIEITLLGGLVRLPQDPELILRALEPQVHGIRLLSPPRSGLLLPQVARRHGWGTLDLLQQVSRKARLGPEAWRLPSTELHAFRAASFGLSLSSSGRGEEGSTA